MPNKRIIEYAIRACEDSPCEHKLAAVLYKGGSILRIASNNLKTLSYRKKYFQHGDPSRHAEMNAIHNIPRDVVSSCSLLVVRINKFKKIQSSKPCLACANALYDAGIKRVFYSSYSGEILKLDFDELKTGKYFKELLKDFREVI